MRIGRQRAVQHEQGTRPGNCCMAYLRPALTLALLGFLPAAASALTVHADYSVSLRGFHVGSAKLTAEVDADRYSIVFSGGIRGLARLFSDAATTAKVSGRIGADRLEPKDYSHVWTESGDAETVSMRFAKRGVTEIEAPPHKHPERYVPLTPETNADALDPLSAFLWPVAAEFGAGLCDRTFPLIDGRRRFDIVLTFNRMDSFATRDRSYSVNVVVCSFRYRAIAGQRLGRKSDASIADSGDAEVWMAPVADGLAAPVRIQFRTRAGRIILRATAFGAD